MKPLALGTLSHSSEQMEVIFLASLCKCGTALKVMNHLRHHHCALSFFTLHNKFFAFPHLSEYSSDI
jgi:hypothetical protein